MSWQRIIRRGVFVGSGSDGVSEPFIAELIYNLCGKQSSPETVTVTYLGTATYDKEIPRVRQTQWFADRGCKVLFPIIGMQATSAEVDVPNAKAAIGEADIVIVSGGNTLFMLDRWRKCGIVEDLRAAALRGAVMCGGSAGAIAWFDAGHSDSLDSSTYRVPPSLTHVPPAADGGGEYDPNACSTQSNNNWRYVRVPCLGFLPGLACPHHDMTQSNGVPRADDFAAMMTPAERGICIDHWAALVIEADTYRVVCIPGKPGSALGCVEGDLSTVATATYVPSQGGIPAVWTVEKDPVTGKLVKQLAPWTGHVEDLLRPANAAVPDDAALVAGRLANPVN